MKLKVSVWLIVPNKIDMQKVVASAEDSPDWLHPMEVDNYRGWLGPMMVFLVVGRPQKWSMFILWDGDNNDAAESIYKTPSTGALSDTRNSGEFRVGFV